MTLSHTTRMCVILVIAGMTLIGGSPATALIQTYIGDVVTLQGYSYSGDYVYLFLTGPNLDPDGVALDNIYRPASQGATQVSVDSDGHWEYKWSTSSPGGKLDAGAYTVWVTDGPASRSDLAFVDYSTINVELSNPYVSVNGPSVPVQPGSMDLNSTPDEASVVINGAFRGTTPLTLSGLDPGVYNVSLLEVRVRETVHAGDHRVGERVGSRCNPCPPDGIGRGQFDAGRGQCHARRVRCGYNTGNHRQSCDG